MEDVDMLAFYVAILDTEEQKDKFTEIYTTYYGMMYQVARAITHDDKLAEDALHETCLELIEKIDSIRTDNAKQLAYYLRMVTRNRTIDFMRKWDRRSALSYDAVDVEPASLHEDAADVVLTKMRLETTLKSLDEMPPVYRTALILRVQGYSIKELKFTQPKGDYADNIIYMSLTLHSSRYGDFTYTEYIQCYNLDAQSDTQINCKTE
jgi:RNA polymerase sigma-70 factor (ECF subfamily)